MVDFRGRILSVAEAERLLRGPGETLPAILLATGEEAWLRDRLVQGFRAGGEASGAEVRRLEADDLTQEDLESALAALPLFGAGVRLWIREGSKLAKGPLDSLLAWAAGPAEGVRVLVTTAREVGELKSLEWLAARGAVAVCAAHPAEREGWVRRMAEEAGLKLPAGLLSAVAASTPSLLAASQEIGKLAAFADPSGRVPPGAAESLRGAAAESSLSRWVERLLARDRAGARAESAALARGGVGGTSALWALAERALGALEPGGFGWPRRPAAPAVSPEVARRLLDAVYRADRALKRGELKDADLMETLSVAAEDALRGTGKERAEA